MRKYRIATYAAGDPDEFGAVIHFQELLWHGGLQRNAAYLDWKYSQNPYLDHRYLMLAWEADELIGMVGAFGACWESNDGYRVMLPCLADAVVSPRYRGGRLFGDMVAEILERVRTDAVPWLLDFGNGLAAPALLIQGWKAIGPWAIATATPESRVAEELVWTHALDGPRRQGRHTGIPIQASRSPRPEAMAKLVGKLPPPMDGVHRHVRDEQYLSWWYRNPLARYFYLLAGSDVLDGYLAAHRSLDPGDSATPTTIVDCEATSDDVWIDLLEVGLSVLPGRSVLIWTRDVPPSRLARLGTIGFVQQQPTGQLTKDWRLPSLIVRSTGAPASPSLELDEPTAWDLRGVCGRSWR